MKYYVGLGNPGTAYRFTPHNLGIIFINRLILEKKLVKEGSVWKGNGYISTYPNTYMNLSGKSVRKLYEHSGMNPKQFLSNLFIVHDDVGLPMHVIREKDGSVNNGLGGHNGLRSIVAEFQYLGLTRNEASAFNRIRLGCQVKTQNTLADYVLSPMPPQDLLEWDKIITEYVKLKFV
jgi:PTH1 family peptidyl-tRNA hydrolase